MRYITYKKNQALFRSYHSFYLVCNAWLKFISVSYCRYIDDSADANKASFYKRDKREDDAINFVRYQESVSDMTAKFWTLFVTLRETSAAWKYFVCEARERERVQRQKTRGAAHLRRIKQYGWKMGEKRTYNNCYGHICETSQSDRYLKSVP